MIKQLWSNKYVSVGRFNFLFIKPVLPVDASELNSKGQYRLQEQEEPVR